MFVFVFFCLKCDIVAALVCRWFSKGIKVHQCVFPTHPPPAHQLLNEQKRRSQFSISAVVVVFCFVVVVVVVFLFSVTLAPYGSSPLSLPPQLPLLCLVVVRLLCTFTSADLPSSFVQLCRSHTHTHTHTHTPTHLSEFSSLFFIRLFADGAIK